LNFFQKWSIAPDLVKLACIDGIDDRNEPYHIDESMVMKYTTKGKLNMYEVKFMNEKG
jgi:hypothetical protein